ncbi:MAG: TMEM165/GDT1 family protein [Acidimicrobiales bacterium]|nr:TMEM165/GDT1 family protein [Acidimicrobiales bacterium]
MRLSVIAAVFPLVFVAELPDKTMFASLLLASKGRPLAVWIGAAAAFAVHVVIAVSVGVVVFNLLPHRAVDAVVAAMFLGGAVWSLLANREENVRDRGADQSAAAVAGTAAVVIFLAEWGDLTQILTANLAAAYHSWLSVGIGALAALLAVAAIAVASGARLLTRVPVRRLRVVTAVVLIGLAAFTVAQAV